MTCLTDAYLQIKSESYDLEVKAEDLQFKVKKVDVYENAKELVLELERGPGRVATLEGTITIQGEDYDKLLIAIIEGHGGEAIIKH